MSLVELPQGTGGHPPAPSLLAEAPGLPITAEAQVVEGTPQPALPESPTYLSTRVPAALVIGAAAPARSATPTTVVAMPVLATSWAIARLMTLSAGPTQRGRAARPTHKAGPTQKATRARRFWAGPGMASASRSSVADASAANVDPCSPTTSLASPFISTTLDAVPEVGGSLPDRRNGAKRVLLLPTPR